MEEGTVPAKANLDPRAQERERETSSHFSREEGLVLLSDFKKFIRPQLPVGKVTVIKDAFPSLYFHTMG